MPDESTLYERLGGYDAVAAVAAVANNLLPRLMNDGVLGRFWEHRGEDGIGREKQLLIDFLCHSAGGPMYYTGRNMTLTHRGMKISDPDWARFLEHFNDTLDHFELAATEMNDVLAFIESTKFEIAEA
jgi:hemoglobin